jgi:hypothetical protein
VEVKKPKHANLGAIINLDSEGVRIDDLIAGGILEQTKQFQRNDRIVNINGEDMTRKELTLMSKEEFDQVIFATLKRHSPALKLTVSRSTDIAKESAAKEISGQKEIEDLEAAIREYEKEGVVFSKGEEALSRPQSPEIGFIIDLGQLAMDIMSEAKLMFEKRGGLNKWFFAPSYTKKVKKLQDGLNA